MPPQTLIQDVEQFQALHNLGGDIGDIKMWFINLPLHCLRKKDHVKTTHFWETKLHGWWHCDKHNNGCTRYLLGVGKIKFIIYKLAKKTKTSLSFTCGYIKVKKSSRYYFITRDYHILVQIRVGHVTSWWTVKILKKPSTCWPLRFASFCQKYQNCIYVSFGMYSVTQCGNSGIKAVYNNKK